MWASVAHDLTPSSACAQSRMASVSSPYSRLTDPEYPRSARNGPARAAPPRWPRTAPSHECAAGCPSSTVTSAASPASGASNFSTCDTAPRSPRAWPAPPPATPRVQPVRTGDRQQPGPRDLILQLGKRRLGLRRHRSLIGQRPPCPRRRRNDPVRPRRSPRPDPATGRAARSAASTAAATRPNHPASAYARNACRSAPKSRSSSICAGS